MRLKLYFRITLSSRNVAQRARVKWSSYRPTMRVDCYRPIHGSCISYRLTDACSVRVTLRCRLCICYILRSRYFRDFLVTLWLSTTMYRSNWVNNNTNIHNDVYVSDVRYDMHTDEMCLWGMLYRSMWLQLGVLSIFVKRNTRLYCRCKGLSGTVRLFLVGYPQTPEPVIPPGR